MARYTVDSLLEKAGRSRGKSSSKPGYDFDHIVELQLIVAALNALPSEYKKEELGSLVDFFNDARNLREVSTDHNRKKGQAVKNFIDHRPSQPGDKDHIQFVRDHWHGKLEGNLQNFPDFKKKLNEILGKQMPN